MIKVSVILTTHNLQTIIKQTMLSLISQEFHNFEIIIVDDGSTDKTFEIVQKYAKEFNFIKAHQIEHQGVGNARNFGLKKARGEYVIFLDGDDLFDTCLVYETYKKAFQEKADICLCNSCEFKYNQKNIIKYHKNDDIYPIGWAWDKLIKRKLIEKYDLKFCNLKSSEDLSFVYAAWLLADKKVQIDQNLVYRRLRENSISFNRREEDAFLALIDLKEKLVKLDKFNDYKNDFYNIALKFVFWQFKAAKNFKVRKNIFAFIKTFESQLDVLSISDIKYNNFYKFYYSAFFDDSFVWFLFKYYIGRLLSKIKLCKKFQ